MTSRLFVAVRPPLEVIEDLADFAGPRQSRDDTLRWTDPERWHITVAFMPSAPADRYDEFVPRLQFAASRKAPFELAIAGAGSFPDPARAKLLWVGVDGDLAELGSLSASVRTAASTAGIAVDGTRFRPHLTLARMNPPVQATRWLRSFDLYRSQRWQINDIELIESQRNGRGTGRTYRLLESIRLGH